jgi:hypothetical protein
MEELDLDSPTWRKSSYSSSGNCVEVGADGRTPNVSIRDTKSRERGMLAVSAETFAEFIANAKAGRLDLSALPARN